MGRHQSLARLQSLRCVSHSEVFAANVLSSRVPTIYSYRTYSKERASKTVERIASLLGRGSVWLRHPTKARRLIRAYKVASRRPATLSMLRDIVVPFAASTFPEAGDVLYADGATFLPDGSGKGGGETPRTSDCICIPE